MEEMTKQEKEQQALFLHELRENTLEGVLVSNDYCALIGRVWNRTVIVPAFVEGPNGFEGAFIKSVAGSHVEIYTKSTLVARYAYDIERDSQNKKMFEASCEELQLVYVTKGK